MISDATLRISNTTTGVVQHVLTGHTSRVWDCATSPTVDSIASASGDGTIRIWSPEGQGRGVLYGDGGDVYSLSWRPSGVCPFFFYSPITGPLSLASSRSDEVLMNRIKSLLLLMIGY
jgi:WD40 repeat protein